MWLWFFSGYAVFNGVLVSYATHVALSGKDQQQRRDAFKVLKLIWTTATGTGGLVAIAIRLHDLGVL